MKTQDARWMRMRDLFEQAVDMPLDQREAFIAARCGDDPELRDELHSLLASDVEHAEAAESRGPLTGAIGAAVDATTRTRREELLGATIGPYRLTSILGHGGAGTVYLGERIDRQYSAQVAIKVVEAAALNAEIGRRFKAERQILASLNHPNIARLIDAGESVEGYPYLVMEYVHGESIDKYCDRMKLTVEQRVELILKVCSAVQYAHQNLVVHRDLKPGNILVTPDGTPKLLDFGIAKLLDTSDAAAAMALTRMNDRVLTPEYASPEQILGQTVTTSSDVYSLGVVLFELLTGFRPYKVSNASQLELERTICVVDATRASTLVRQAVASPTNAAPQSRDIRVIAESRQVTPMRLRARLNGDLDAILMRALRKEAVHRYSSVEQFASDLRRHLAREPVLARQGNWAYYAQRFARRHAIGVSATAAFIALLTAALIMMSIQAKRITEQRDAANREKQTSEAVANFMVNVFAAADPFTVQDKQVTATELLDKATQNIRAEFEQQPSVKAKLLEAMGRTYSRQGQTEKGIMLTEESVALRRKIEDPNSQSFAAALISLGKAQLKGSSYLSAEAPLHEARRILEDTNRTESPEYAYVLSREAELENKRGNLRQAYVLFEKAIPIFRKVFGTRDPETAMALFSYGYAKTWESDFATSKRLAQEAVDIYRAARPETDPDRISAERLLGVSLLFTGHPSEAEPLLTKSYWMTKRVFGDRSKAVVDCLKDLVDLHRSTGDFAAAEKYAREALQIGLNSDSGKSYETGQSRETLAIILWKRGKFAEAEKELRAALDIYRSTIEPDHLFVSASEHFLAEVLLSQNRVEEARNQLVVTIARLKRAGAVQWRVARSENTLGQALAQLNDRESAGLLLERSYRILSDVRENAPIDTIKLAHDRLEQYDENASRREKATTP